jgi:hypothetical protein
MRALAEKNIAQTREIYERSKDALDTVLESWGKVVRRGRSGRRGVNARSSTSPSATSIPASTSRRDWRGKEPRRSHELHATYRRKDYALQSCRRDAPLSTKVTADAPN